jgi:hypothetical protein
MLVAIFPNSTNTPCALARAARQGFHSLLCNWTKKGVDPLKEENGPKHSQRANQLIFQPPTYALGWAAFQGFNSLLCNWTGRTRRETQNKEYQTKPKCLPINHSTIYLGVAVLLPELLSRVSNSTACCATGQYAPGVKPKTKSAKPNQSVYQSIIQPPT